MAAAARICLAVLLLAFLVLLRDWSLMPHCEATPTDAAFVQRGPSPMALAAQYVYLDVAYLRWLWWPVILYLFWGMAYVCDVYFVRTIDVISERFQIPDDVAGATLMALGCNGPEMALNTIAIFHPSNIGVGAVIGGEVFNVLVIIGTAILATPAAYLPLKLGRFNFFRDVTFYVASVTLLYWVLRDGSVTRVKASVLLFGAVLYTLTVTFSGKIRSLLSRQRRQVQRETRRLTRNFTRNLTLHLKPEMLPDDLGTDDDSDTDEAPHVDPELLAQWERSRQCEEPSEGSVLGVRVDVRNRLMDRNHRMEQRFVCLRDGALLVSTVRDPTRPRGEASEDMYHGGLVNQPVIFEAKQEPGLTQAFSATPISQLTRPLLNEAPKKSLIALEAQRGTLDLSAFKDAPWEVIPLEDVLYCERAGDVQHFSLHVHLHDSDLGSLVTLEFCAQQANAWVDSLCHALKEIRRGQEAEVPEAQNCSELLAEWAEWLQFPVKFCLKATIPDMDNPKLQGWYPVAFTLSMAWLALFAYCVVAACDGIHADFGVSDSVLGFTVAAAGTSFPNVFSGMVVARQGKTSMAVANALGANVQNVFLALAVPWCVQTFIIRGGPFPLVVHDLLPAVIECMATLLPVVAIYVCCASSMPRWSGAVYLLTYVVYLVFALGQQASGLQSGRYPVGCLEGSTGIQQAAEMAATLIAATLT
eukprot:CAMPEP_0171060596 /NCGR_PEP_ID=MMETSP0766_2-20121228/3932_1 /TAXON_ID=439317 /ORGANISM="Gambierdiscus australes, Strain CAWD 149" /LENGTH=698 /DNA_ID=CAMNT_0011516193 /DNA_START=73 /DNA_END=2167 /DNA_ORIENTATION=-